MSNETNQPNDKELKMIGGLYGNGKRREDWVGEIGGSEKRNIKIHSVIIEVAIRFIEKFRMWEGVEIMNCWYSREVS